MSYAIMGTFAEIFDDIVRSPSTPPTDRIKAVHQVMET